MKNIMLQDYIVNFLISHQFKTIFNVPGWGGTEVYRQAIDQNADFRSKICYNEEAALGMSLGSAQASSRSALLIKTHGLPKATNALLSGMSVLLNAAALIFVFDDVEGKSSDNVLNILPLLGGLETPWFDLTPDHPEKLLQALIASEYGQMPVIVYVRCHDLVQKLSGTAEKIKMSKLPALPLIQNQLKFPHRLCFLKNAAPVVSTLQRAWLLKRLSLVAQWRALEILELDEHHLLLRQQYLLEWEQQFDSNFFSSIDSILPPKLMEAFSTYRPFFNAFKKISTHFVTQFVSGDAGTSSLYAFPPFHCITTTTYMGGAPGMALGAWMGGAEKCWAITGDFSFLGGGILGWQEIISAQAPIKLVILYNAQASATGGQEVNAELYEIFKCGHQKYLHVASIDTPQDKLVTMLEEMNSISDKPQVLLLHCAKN